MTQIVNIASIGGSTGPTTLFTYNSGNTVVTDPNQNQWTYGYDSQGRVTNFTTPLQHTTQTQWTSDNHVSQIQLPETGHTTTFTYDSLNNLKQVTLGTGAYETAQYTDPTFPYFPTQLTDGQGNPTNITYYDSSGPSGPAGTVASVKDGRGNSQSFTYNGNGTIASATDENQHTTQYSYVPSGSGFDSGLLKTVTPPSPLGTTSYTYDSYNRPATETDGKGQLSTFGYDLLDQLTSLTFTNSDGTSGGSDVYTYDNNGNVTSLTDATGSTTYQYNGLDQQTSKLLPSGSKFDCPGTTTQASVCYSYDPSGNMLTKQDSAGTITYHYNTDNSLSYAQGRDLYATTFAYDADGNLQSEAFSTTPAVTQAMTYNNAEQLTNIKATKPGSTLTSYTYSYLNSSNQPAEIPSSVTDGVRGFTTALSYNGNNQLTEAKQSGNQSFDYKYGYDPAGNLNSINSNGSATTLNYNAANELTSTSGAMNASYIYDGNGDRTSMTSGGLTTSYAINAQHQVSSITPPHQNGIAMSYTGLGMGERVGSGSSSYTYDAGGMSSQTVNQATTEFTTLPGGGVVSESTPQDYYYLSDGAGNVAGVVDASGNLVKSYQYDPLGNITQQTGSAPNPLTFQGSAYDSSTGLYYTGSNYYDPTTGQCIGNHDQGPTDPGEDCGNVNGIEDENPACGGVCSGGPSTSAPASGQPGTGMMTPQPLIRILAPGGGAAPSGHRARHGGGILGQALGVFESLAHQTVETTYHAVSLVANSGLAKVFERCVAGGGLGLITAHTTQGIWGGWLFYNAVVEYGGARVAFAAAAWGAEAALASEPPGALILGVGCVAGQVPMPS